MLLFPVFLFLSLIPNIYIYILSGLFLNKLTSNSACFLTVFQKDKNKAKLKGGVQMRGSQLYYLFLTFPYPLLKGLTFSLTMFSFFGWDNGGGPGSLLCWSKLKGFPWLILMNGCIVEGHLSWQFVFLIWLCSAVSSNFCFMRKVISRRLKHYSFQLKLNIGREKEMTKKKR